MARDFDGANDNIDFGTDATLDGFTTQSIAMWVHKDLTATFMMFLGKDRFAANWGFGDAGTPGDKLYFERDWSGANGAWESTTAMGTSAPKHFAVTYDGGATGNDPVFYINGAVDTTVELTAPTGGLNSDATPNLRAGETGGNGADYDGRLGWICYHNALFTAADVNRARYWGRPFGGLKFYHPLMTTKLANEGTATATGTASGTTVIGMAVPVVRPGSALLGFGVGW